MEYLLALLLLAVISVAIDIIFIATRFINRMLGFSRLISMIRQQRKDTENVAITRTQRSSQDRKTGA